MPPPFADSPEFRRLLLGDDAADLTRIALEIARDAEPEIRPDIYLAKIDRLAERVRDRCPSGARLRHLLGQINWVLYVEEGYQGNDDDYYDPRNSYLSSVIDRRLGIPITLAVLYRAVAERLGLEPAGVNLPAHFMLRAGRGGEVVFIDPFDGGALLDRQGCERRLEQRTGFPVTLTDEHLAPCSTAVVVTRMLRNLKGIYHRAARYSELLPVQRRLAALNRLDPVEQRDLGLTCLRLERPGEAIDPLQAYLSACPVADDAETIRLTLAAARRQVATWN